MNRFLAYSAFAAMSVLFVGCSTPQQGGPHADANQDALTVQRLARLHACDPVRDAMPMSTPGDAMQRFEVHCSNGQTLAFGCHDGQCAESAATTTAAGAQAAPAAAVTDAPATSAQPRYQDPAPAGGAFAARYSNPLHFAASLGGAFGGDSLATVTYSNNSSVNLDAGRGAQFSFGVDYRIDPQFAVLANAGYQVVVAAASNGNLRFQRYPLEGIGYYYLNNQWRVGAGLRYVVSPELVGSGVANGANVDFSNTLGGIVEIEWLPAPMVGIKLRGVDENYKVDGYSQKYSGKSVGLFGTFYF